MSTHAKLSASGSHRWIACPGSVKAEDGRPDTQNPSAAEGTMLHELAERCLTEGISPFNFEGEPLFGFTDSFFTREQCEVVETYIDFLKSLGGHQSYENRVDFSDWVKDGFGTADAIVFKDGVLHVVDLKTGQGVRVDAFENTQGLLYALGAYAANEYIYDIQRITITIVQPRLDHIDEWTIGVDELMKKGEWLSQKAEEALTDNAPRVPSENACQFCRARAVCPALKEHTEKAILSEFENLEIKNADALTDEQLKTVMDNKALIVGWLGAVEDLISDRLMSGKEFAGYKLVSGRSSRKWIDENEAEKVLKDVLGDDAYEVSLLSVAKAEKALGKSKKDLIANYVQKLEGKPTVAPESDKRPAIAASFDDFENLDE